MKLATSRYHVPGYDPRDGPGAFCEFRFDWDGRKPSRTMPKHDTFLGDYAADAYCQQWFANQDRDVLLLATVAGCTTSPPSGAHADLLDGLAEPRKRTQKTGRL